MRVLACVLTAAALLAPGAAATPSGLKLLVRDGAKLSLLVVWAPTGERAAAVTKHGGAVVWTPAADGSLLFVRTRARSRQTGPGSWIDTQKGRVLLLAHGRLRQVAEIGFTQPDSVYTYPVQFYGHYDWTQFLAVAP